MSKTRPAYFCYTCSEEVTFRGTRIRYNLGGSLHLCKADDKIAYEKYRKYTYDNTGWRVALQTPRFQLSHNTISLCLLPLLISLNKYFSAA
jgi:hypothetical protein